MKVRAFDVAGRSVSSGKVGPAGEYVTVIYSGAAREFEVVVASILGLSFGGWDANKSWVW